MSILAVAAMALLSGSCGDDSTRDGPSDSQSVDEHAAIATIREYRRIELAQLLLPEPERDLTVFTPLFSGGRHDGVVAGFTIDIGAALVLEVQGNENSYDVVEDQGDSVVIHNCESEEFVWSDPVEPEPYLMTGRALFRFELVLTSEGWRIADFVAISSTC